LWNLSPTKRKGKGLVRRSILLLGAMLAALVVVSGVALAADFYGTDGDDTIKGTPDDDYIVGYDGNDQLDGQGGIDEIVADNENSYHTNDDVVRGGAGNDYLYAYTGNDEYHGDGDDDWIDASETYDWQNSQYKDYVDCGPGTDHVYYDSTDTVVNCEVWWDAH
jgi:hypothetical protein